MHNLAFRHSIVFNQVQLCKSRIPKKSVNHIVEIVSSFQECDTETKKSEMDSISGSSTFSSSPVNPA